MALDLPTFRQIIDRTRADLAANLPGVDPTLYGSYVRALSDSLSGRIYDMVLLIEQLSRELFPQTSSGEYLERWAGYEGLTRKSASEATGLVTFVGVTGLTFLYGTQLRADTGELYRTKAGITLSYREQSLSSLTSDSGTATATTGTDHQLATGMTVTIAGATEPEYNGAFAINVTGLREFTYEITGSPTSPATGSPKVEYTGAPVVVESINEGQVTNLDGGASLTLITPVSGESVSIITQYEGLQGGADEETDEGLLDRTMQSRANPVANFNVAAIEKVVLSVPGVTRVKVKPITPGIGDVTILFVRDNDPSIIPSQIELDQVKDALVPIIPANTSPDDVHVPPLLAVEQAFSFSIIDPDTPSMREAIRQNLIAFFEDEVTFESTVTKDKYRSAIINTIDPETGQVLSSFALTSPTDDIVVGENEIAVLGDVIF